MISLSLVTILSLMISFESNDQFLSLVIILSLMISFKSND